VEDSIYSIGGVKSIRFLHSMVISTHTLGAAFHSENLVSTFHLNHIVIIYLLIFEVKCMISYDCILDRPFLCKGSSTQVTNEGILHKYECDRICEKVSYSLS